MIQRRTTVPLELDIRAGTMVPMPTLIMLNHLTSRKETRTKVQTNTQPPRKISTRSQNLLELNPRTNVTCPQGEVRDRQPPLVWSSDELSLNICFSLLLFSCIICNSPELETKKKNVLWMNAKKTYAATAELIFPRKTQHVGPNQIFFRRFRLQV